jgi:hypothetical protein
VNSMRISAGLAVVGVLLVLIQGVWAPGADVPRPVFFAPAILGLGCLLGSVVLGLVRGTWLYRLAVLLGLLGLALIVASFILPLDRGVAGPRPSPTNAEIARIAGLLLSLLSSIAGTIAIVRGRGVGLRRSS